VTIDEDVEKRGLSAGELYQNEQISDLYLLIRDCLADDATIIADVIDSVPLLLRTSFTV